MHPIVNQLGEIVAHLESIPIGDATVALVLVWTPENAGSGEGEDASIAAPGRALPTPAESVPSFAQAVAELTSHGAHTFATRVVTFDADLDPVLTDERAAWYRAVLRGLGFTWEEDRVEYRLPLQTAVTALQGQTAADRLIWRSVATEAGPELDRASTLLSAVAAEDPELSTPARALGFLLARREDRKLLLTPECIQVGALGDEDVAIVIPSVAPENGWCSLYYMGVLPGQRGRGLGLETMRRGFAVMASLGGRTYHDGTGATNEAALALFRRLGVPPYRRMEEWAARVPSSEQRG